MSPGPGPPSPATDLLAARAAHTMKAMVVAGGRTGFGTRPESAEIFDPATGAFSAGPELPRPVDGLAAASLADGCAMLVE